MADQKENITTILNLPEAGTISDSDVLYLLQGSGSDRDRQTTVGKLLNPLNQKVGWVKVSYDDSTPSSLDGKLSGNGDLTFDKVSESNIAKLKPMLKDGVVKESHLGKVLASKINNVTGDRLVDGAVTTAKLADNSVVAQKMGLFDISKDTAETTYSLYERAGELGNIIILYSSTGNVTIDYNPTGSAATGYTKDVSQTSACMFICLGKDSFKNLYRWSPIGGV